MGKPHQTVIADLKLPPGWRGDRLPWDMARCLEGELNKLRLWEQKWPSKEIRRAMKIGVLDRSISAVREVVDALVAEGLDAAYTLFNCRFEKTSLRFPALGQLRETLMIRGRAKEIRRRVFIKHHKGPIFPPPLCLWTLLVDSRLAYRFRKCPECGIYFLDRTRNSSAKYCTLRCTSRVSSRDYRHAGKEREARRTRRVTTKQTKPHPE